MATYMMQFLRLWTLVEDVQLQPAVEDRIVWLWTPDGKYSSTSAYRAFFAARVSMLGAKELWSVQCLPKVKFFFWLAMHGRLWTADRRKRHGLQDDDTCVLCDQDQEHTDHLLLTCPYASEIWHRLLLRLGVGRLAPIDDNTFLDWWLSARALAPGRLRRGLDSIILLASWMLCKERNRRTFDGIAATMTVLLQRLREEADSWLAAGYKSLGVFAA